MDISLMLKKLAEKKLFAFCLLALVAAGAAILILANHAPEPEELFFEREEYVAFSQTHEPEVFAREEALERRLEEFFSLVEGAGNVRVMISPLGTRETVFAVDTNSGGSHTTESDSQGGTRETRTYQNNEKIVLLANRQGQDVPLVLREVEPRIEGIVIIAEGGDSPIVRDALTRAARAVLGLEAHNIQILNMQ